jgi:hypothetical protein
VEEPIKFLNKSNAFWRKIMNLAKIDELLKNIKFDGFYIEATFRFKLLMRLAKIFDIAWNRINNNFRYFIVDVNPSQQTG